MGILYGMVARGPVVLAEFSATQSNASVVAKKILAKINQGNHDSNVSYSHDRYVFHVKRTDGLTVLCMADDAFGSELLFSFLFSSHLFIVIIYERGLCFGLVVLDLVNGMEIGEKVVTSSENLWVHCTLTMCFANCFDELRIFLMP